jgi:hypothetical protein
MTLANQTVSDFHFMHISVSFWPLTTVEFEAQRVSATMVAALKGALL